MHGLPTVLRLGGFSTGGGKEEGKLARGMPWASYPFLNAAETSMGATCYTMTRLWTAIVLQLRDVPLLAAAGVLKEACAF